MALCALSWETVPAIRSISVSIYRKVHEMRIRFQFQSTVVSTEDQPLHHFCCCLSRATDCVNGWCQTLSHHDSWVKIISVIKPQSPASYSESEIQATYCRKEKRAPKKSHMFLMRAANKTTTNHLCMSVCTCTNVYAIIQILSLISCVTPESCVWSQSTPALLTRSPSDVADGAPLSELSWPSSLAVVAVSFSGLFTFVFLMLACLCCKKGDIGFKVSPLLPPTGGGM